MRAPWWRQKRSKRLKIFSVRCRATLERRRHVGTSCVRRGGRSRCPRGRRLKCASRGDAGTTAPRQNFMRAPWRRWKRSARPQISSVRRGVTLWRIVVSYLHARTVAAVEEIRAAADCSVHRDATLRRRRGAIPSGTCCGGGGRGPQGHRSRRERGKDRKAARPMYAARAEPRL